MYSLLLACAFAQGPIEPLPDLRGEVKPSRPVVEVPRLFVKSITHPDRYLAMVEKHQLKLPEEDRYYTRFFVFNQAPTPLLKDYVLLWLSYYNTVNPAPVLARFYEVEGSEGRVVAFDLRNTRLTIEAITAVIRRDQQFREPHVDSDLAERCRRLAGVQQDPETLHCDVMVPALWVMRNVMEPGKRTSDMYDMLYPEQRFGPTQFKYAKQTVVGTTDVVKTWKQVEAVYQPGKPWEGDGKNYDKPFPYKKWVEVDESVKRFSISGQQKVVPKLLKDFPEDLEQFQDHYGISESQKIVDKARLFAKRGEIVAGSKNDLKKGSIVSYNDRLFEVFVTAGGYTYARTRDFEKTSGLGNIANDPRGAALGDLKEAAGEHLFTLPCGFQTPLLTNAAKAGRKRVEAGDAEIVHASAIDKSFVVVKNGFSCVLCHARDNGFIAPSNRKVQDSWHRGTRLGQLDPYVKQGIEAFFTGWDEDMDVWRLPYKKALRSLTQGRDDLGWDGNRFAVVTQQFRDWYDAPLGLDQASAELGLPRSALIILLASYKIPVDEKLEQNSYDVEALLAGGTIPRAEWDDVLYRKIALLFSIARNSENPHPLFQLFYPDLLRQVAEKKFK